MINYAAILTNKYPGTQWALSGDTYEGLDWLDSTPKPTQTELDALSPQVNYEEQVKEVESTRRLQYEIQSDGLFFEWQRGTNTKEAWEAAVQSVKDANPYPPAPTKKK
jgi:hypothetical protein